MSFKDLGLSEKVLAAVEASGYTEPTPIQAQAIPPALTGRDILGIAQTGTGKTAAFVLPMLSRLEQGRARARMPRTLILEPTRELAAQVEEAFNKYGVNYKLNVALLIGGVAFGDQEAKIMRGADVLIATPGRLLDFHERGKLLLTGIDILVIDEADRMLDMGFIPDIEKICKLVPFTRQTLFFSATMPPEITRLTEQFLQNPLRIEVSRVGTTAANITQGLLASHGGREKRETLRRMLRGAENFRNAIIFCNRKRDVAILHKSLVKHGFSAGALHGDMDQTARTASLDAFKNGDVSLIVCSDVAARGLDIPDVSHVFNFDVPIHPDDYVHRIGRTGRAGKSGTAISIVTADDVRAMDAIEKVINRKIDWIGPGLDSLGEPPEDERPRGRGRPGRGQESRGQGSRGRGSRNEGRRSAGSRSTVPNADGPGSDGPDAEGAYAKRASAEGAHAERSLTQGARAEGPRGERANRHGRSRDRNEGEERPRRNRPQAPFAIGAEQPDVPGDYAGMPFEPRPARYAARPATDATGDNRAYDARAPRREPSQSERRYRERDDGPPVVGLGDHMPAFLTRPVVIRRAKDAPRQKAAAEE